MRISKKAKSETSENNQLKVPSDFFATLLGNKITNEKRLMAFMKKRERFQGLKNIA